MKNESERLFSEVVKSDTIAGLALSENSYPSNYKTRLHSHDYTYFCFVLGGNYTLRYRNDAHLCRSSKILFFPSGTDHACFMHTHSRCFNIQLNSQILEFLSDGRDLPSDKVVQNSRELRRLALRLYQEFYSIDEFSPLTIEGLASEITAEFHRRTGDPTPRTVPNWLLSAREFIEEEFTEAPTITSIARSAGIHPTHLAREFRRHFGITIGDFVRLKRIEFASHRIVETKKPLCEIALEAGFCDQSHLTKIFKKATGMTPASYRSVFR